MFIPSKSTVVKVNEQKKATNNVTKWVFDRLATVDPLFTTIKYQVMVSEIQCNEPDCVPIETLIIIMLMSDPVDLKEIKPKQQRWANKILKPISEVTVDDVDQIVDIMLEEYELKDSTILISTDQVKADSVDGDESIKVLLPTPAGVFVPLATDAVSNMNIPEVTRVKMQPNHAATLQKNNNVITVAGYVQEPRFPVSVPSQVSVALSQSTPSSAGSVPSIEAPNTVTNTKTMKNVTMPSTATKKPNPVADMPVPAATGTSSSSLAPRHKKGGTRPRGCPCCDPDNLDNILDTMMFSHYPQT